MAPFFLNYFFNRKKAISRLITGIPIFKPIDSKRNKAIKLIGIKKIANK
jgi:hypothetical protein